MKRHEQEVGETEEELEDDACLLNSLATHLLDLEVQWIRGSDQHKGPSMLTNAPLSLST